MNFAALAQNAAQTAHHHLGQDAVYTPAATGVPMPVRIVVQRDVDPFPAGFDSSVTQRQVLVRLLYTEIPAPDIGDSITIDGEQHLVDDVIINNRVQVTVAVRRG